MNHRDKISTVIIALTLPLGRDRAEAVYNELIDAYRELDDEAPGLLARTLAEIINAECLGACHEGDE
mgnify:CR=1 FL=1